MSAPSILPFPLPPQSNLIPPSSSHPLPSNTPSDPSFPLPPQSLLQQQPPTPQVGSTNKEIAPIPTQPQPESAPLVELQETEKLPVEVEGYLQKLDQAGEIKLPEPITHDGEVLLADSEAQVIKEKIVLPMSQSAHQQGIKAKVNDSARWLAEWCLRLIKIMKDGVKYAEEPSSNG